MKPHIVGSMTPFSEYEIDLYMVGDASSELTERVEARVGADPDFAAIIDEQRAEREAFYVTRPRLPQPAPSRAKTSWLFAAVGGLAVAATAALLMVVVPAQEHRSSSLIRTRGGLKVTLTVRRDERIFPYEDSVRLHAGDQVRVTIESPAAGFLSVVGREAGNTWSVLYDAVPVRAGSFTAPGSRVMDSSLVEETWYVFLTPDPVSALEIVERLKAGDAIPGDASTLVIRKQPVP